MAQVVHAAGESSPGNLPSGTIAIVLTASSEQLYKLEHKLTQKEVAHRAIREPDLNDELVAIGICPTATVSIHKMFSNFPLAKKCCNV